MRPQPPCTERAKQLKTKFLNLQSVICLKSFLSGWHLGAGRNHILRGNVERFAALGFFEKELHKLSREQRDVVSEIVAESERAWGLHFEEGYSPHVQIMPGYDKLRSIHKPLTIYALLHALGWGLSIFLRQLGYSPINQDGLTFWIWKPAKINKATKGSTITGAGASSPAPLVFFQGLGPLLPTFVSDIRKVGGGRTVILLQAKHLFFSLQWRAPSATEVARATTTLLQRLGHKRACLMGHSHGTFYVSRTYQLFPQVDTPETAVPSTF